MSVYVTPYHVAVPQKNVSKCGITKLRSYIIYPPEGKTKYITAPIALYKQNVKFANSDTVYCLFPRFCATQLCKDGYFSLKDIIYFNPYLSQNINSDLSLHRSSSHFEYAPNFSLTEYQKLIVDYLIEKIYNEDNIKKCKASCILKLDTGAGKTFTAGGLIHKLLSTKPNSKVLYVVLNNNLQDQAERDFTMIFGDDPDNIRITKSYDHIANCNIYIAVINTVMMHELSEFTFIIYDEVHSYSSEKRKEVFWTTKGSIYLGLTAEPADRADLRDRVIWEHLGPIIYEDELEDAIGTQTKVLFNGETHIIPYFNPQEFYAKVIKTPGTNSPNYLMTTENALCFDEARNKILVNIIVSSYREGRPILAVTHHASHVINIADLVKRELGITPEILMGKSSKDRVDCADFDGGSILIGTYAYTAIGTSRKELVSLLFMTYPFKTKQVVGRIIRPNKEFPEQDKVIRKYYLMKDSMFFFKKHFSNVLRFLEFKGFYPVKDVEDFKEIDVPTEREFEDY